MVGICKLCKSQSDLQLSHIVPKGIYKWMKKTGTGRLRIQGKFDTPFQDGHKERLLCLECERKFNKYETIFFNDIFHPYHNKNVKNIEVTEDLIYFSVSVLWRVLVLFKDDGNEYFHKTQMDNLEDEWRYYLNNKNDTLITFSKFHLLLTGSVSEMFFTYKDELVELFPNIVLPNLKLDLYLNRSVDMELIENEHSTLVYAKFSNFILVAEIEGQFEDVLIGTSLNQKTINSSSQYFVDGDYLKFIYDRAINTKNYNDLSEKQKANNEKYFQKNSQKIRSSNYWSIISKFKDNH